MESEFPLEGLRVDTLAYDEQTKSFVIIEYKKRKKFSVIDQGIAYLSLMLDHKADLILDYNEKFDERLKRNDVDWSQSKVIFVSPSYTKYQQAMKTGDLPIELWKVTKYGNDLFDFRRVDTAGGEGIPMGQSEKVRKIKEEVKVYTEEHHLEGKPDKTRELYETLKEEIQNMDSEIEFNPQKYYISLRKPTNFAYIKIKNKFIRIEIKLPKERGDELIKHHKTQKLSKSVQEFYNGPCFRVYLYDDENMDEVINALEEAKKNL